MLGSDCRGCSLQPTKSSAIAALSIRLMEEVSAAA
jgi:hypothetical protein